LEVIIIITTDYTNGYIIVGPERIASERKQDISSAAHDESVPKNHFFFN
jgi:hypothetical protein